ncbi:MAG: GNAT family N-acetyltransferase [Alphaproteobacteria bacterium]|nr:GNAT family N-acetyltransferase [Alphaproteobacteria bacterium]
MQHLKGLELRQAQPADAQALIAILQDTLESTWLPNLTPAAAQAVRNEARPAAYVARRGTKFWLAAHAGDIVGLVDWDGDFINALHVLGRHARTGVGTRLMDKAEAEIAKAGYTAARLETDTFNVASQSFYARRGYIETDRYPDTEWNSGLTTILLVKSL